MQPIFSRNKDINKIAFLNWRISEHDNIRNMKNMAYGFMLSAIELAKVCLANNRNKKADILIFPILTNANHGIELYLKSILWTLNILMKLDSKVEGNHNIKQIYETVRSKIKTYNGMLSLKEFDTATVELKKYIDELYDKINATMKNDRMDFSRYPFSKGYENHFYVGAIGNVEIDLENFVTQFHLIMEKLKEISDYLYDIELYGDDND